MNLGIGTSVAALALAGIAAAAILRMKVPVDRWARAGTALIAAAAGALFAIAVGAVVTTGSVADAGSEREEFLDIPVPADEPAGLTDVRMQDSPANGLELVVLQGQSRFLVCAGMPDQLEIGSCTGPRTELLRTTKLGGGRQARYVLFRGLQAETPKADDTADEAAAIAYWRESPLTMEPEWLAEWGSFS